MAFLLMEGLDDPEGTDINWMPIAKKCFPDEWAFVECEKPFHPARMRMLTSCTNLFVKACNLNLIRPVIGRRRHFTLTHHGKSIRSNAIERRQFDQTTKSPS